MKHATMYAMPLLMAMTLALTACKNSDGPPSKAPESAARAQPAGQPTADRPLPPTQEQLQQWTQTEEGLDRIVEFVGDPDVPLEAQANAIVTLVEAGKADRIRRVVSEAHQPGELATAVGDRLIPLLKGDPDEAVLQVRNALLILLDMTVYQEREPVQEALADWAFRGADSRAAAHTINGLLSERFPVSQLHLLGTQAVTPLLKLLEKGPETRSAFLQDSVDYLVSLEDEGVSARAVRALAKSHEATLENLRGQSDLTFDAGELFLLEKLGGRAAILQLLYLSGHQQLDKGPQFEALLIAKGMVERLPARQKGEVLDELLAAIVRKLPVIRGASGQARLRHARFVLENTGIDGLLDVPLIESKKVDGKERQSWRPYMSAKFSTPERFFWGVASDFLRPLVAEQRFELASEQAVAYEETEEYAAKVAAQVDKNVTPMVESWLDGQPRSRRIFGIAGLRYLGTPKAMAALEALKTDTTDLSIYFGEGVTTATLAGNALASIALSAQFDALLAQNVQERRISDDHLDLVRQEVLSRIALPAEELQSEYVTRLEAAQAKYDEQKRKLAEVLGKYQKVIRHICYQQVKVYPSIEDKEKLTVYVDATAVACQEVAEEKLTKAKLDYFQFNHGSYKTAVILALMKKEAVRKYTIKATVRAYLNVTVEVAMADRKVAKRIAEIERWALTSRQARSAVDKIVDQALSVLNADIADPASKTKLTAADIKEYRSYLELPERYALGALILHRFGVAKPTDDTHGPCLLQELAGTAFAADSYFDANPEVTGVLQKTWEDAWFVLSDVQEFQPENTWQRWGLSAKVGEGYMKVYREAEAFVDRSLAQWVADGKLPAELAPVLKKNYPCTELVLDILVGQFEQYRKKTKGQGGES